MSFSDLSENSQAETPAKGRSNLEVILAQQWSFFRRVAEVANLSHGVENKVLWVNPPFHTVLFRTAIGDPLESDHARQVFAHFRDRRDPVMWWVDRGETVLRGSQLGVELLPCQEFRGIFFPAHYRMEQRRFSSSFEVVEVDSDETVLDCIAVLKKVYSLGVGDAEIFRVLATHSLSVEDLRFFVAYSGGYPVGCRLLYFDEFGEVGAYALGVSPDNRSHQLGAMIHSETLKHVRSAGHKRLLGYCTQSMLPYHRRFGTLDVGRYGMYPFSIPYV